MQRARCHSARPAHAPLLFFALLILNCFSISSSSRSVAATTGPAATRMPVSSLSALKAVAATFSLLPLIPPCLAERNSNSNQRQRVDTPSPDDYTPLSGPDFAFTPRTPLGSLKDPREYADGALATQKLIAAPLIPLDRQMWIGVDTRTAYFGNNFSGDKIANVSQLLQAGMRRLVVDLWWDGAAPGWQLCPRIKRNTAQLSNIRMALEQAGSVEEPAIQGMGLPDSQILRAQVLPNHEPAGSASDHLANDAKLTLLQGEETGLEQRQGQEEGPAIRPTFEKRDSNKNKNLLSEKKQGVNSSKMKPTAVRKETHRGPSKDRSITRPSTSTKTKEGSSEWYRRKRPHHRRPIRPKSSRLNRKSQHHGAGKSPTPVAINRVAMGTSSQPARHHVAMNKGIVSTYDRTAANDETVDGITCSSGDDVVILLQSLLNWIQQSTEDELEDVFMLILNLNELTNTSLGSRAPSHPTPIPPIPSTPSPSSLATGQTPTEPTLSNEEFFSFLRSPNTNHTVKALLPRMISLKELFLDAFPSLIYSPHQLEEDRQDLGNTWWKTRPVGLDYYNTTVDPVTGRTQTKTGWPTSHYLTEVINRKVIVGFGANNLKATTTYNITDDYTTIYTSSVLGPAMTNSSLIRITSDLHLDRCIFPMPGMVMLPTGREEEGTLVEELRRNVSGPILSEQSWGFSSMSDTNDAPWSYISGQLAAAMSIWSWDLDQPPIDQIVSRDRRCGVMQSNGRWAVQDCNMKLPVACRKSGTSGVWLIYEKGANNYRDVTCPEGYQFDVPRTSRENRLLYQTLLRYWNETNPSLYTSLMQLQAQENRRLESALQSPYSLLKLFQPTLRKRHEDPNAGDDDDDDDDEDDEYSVNERGHKIVLDEDEKQENENGGNPTTRARIRDKSAEEVIPSNAAKGVLSSMSARAPVAAGLANQGMVWIDISSWQTAGCWVPGGPQGKCPYQDPDNTVALRDMIIVSTVGGGIMLLLVGMFLYLKCRRNVRLRKANKRREDVRNKIMRTEVETVPA
ncbi:hypothetical protein BGZ94_009636 [Podila epigama]|nr:hypothetical protein BGZ94_009636 [Podila epigama]